MKPEESLALFKEEAGHEVVSAFLKLMATHSSLQAHILGKASEYICQEAWEMFCGHINIMSKPAPYGSRKFPHLPCWKYENDSIGELPEHVTKAKWFISVEHCSRDFSPVICTTFD